MAKKSFLRATCVLASCLTIGILAACGGGNTPDPNPDPDPDPDPTPAATVEGWYVLQSKTIEGTQVSGEYLYSAIHLSGGEALWYETDYSGLSLKEGSYTEGETLDIKIGVRTYNFEYDAAAGTLAYAGKENRLNTSWTFMKDANYTLPTATGGVDFTQELFGDDINENFYNYCPTVMMEGNDTMHVWYCSNKDSGIVYDYIAYRKGTLNAAGKWEFGEKQIVLSPNGINTGPWDDKHTCDPTVVKGKFEMGGEEYGYLMAYLGCRAGDVNEVGFAVAKAPEGPWERVGDGLWRGYMTQDKYHYQNEYAKTASGGNYWGYGQPSLVSVDGEGKVLLFYTKGISVGTYTYVEEWDLSNLDNPQLLHENQVRNTGADGNPAAIRNGDFAYDPVRGRLYCIYDPFPDKSGYAVVESQSILSLDLGEEGIDLLFGNSMYTWSKVGSTGPSGSGKGLNHNGGVITDGYGHLLNPYRVPVLYTTASLKDEFPSWQGGGQWPYLHTYRIRGAVFETK